MRNDIWNDYFIIFLDNDVGLAAFKGKNNVKTSEE